MPLEKKREKKYWTSAGLTDNKIMINANLSNEDIIGDR